MSDESVMSFPCSFPIKLMGRDSSVFRRTVRELVEKHTGPLDLVDDSHVDRQPLWLQIGLDQRVGTISLAGLVPSVPVVAESREQLDNIYRDATAHDDVIMAL